MIRFIAFVRAHEDNFCRFIVNFGFLQKEFQGHAGPLGMTNRAGAPLHAVDGRLQVGSSIPGAFHCGENRARGRE